MMIFHDFRGFSRIWRDFREFLGFSSIFGSPEGSVSHRKPSPNQTNGLSGWYNPWQMHRTNSLWSQNVFAMGLSRSKKSSPRRVLKFPRILLKTAKWEAAGAATRHPTDGQGAHPTHLPRLLPASTITRRPRKRGFRLVQTLSNAQNQ